MWMWKKEKKELEITIDDLKASIENLKRQLVNAKVLQDKHRAYHYHGNENAEPIYLVDLRDQIEGIKDFLGIEFVTEPEVAPKSYMKRQKTSENEHS